METTGNNLGNTDSVNRFNNRVSKYAIYRPDYPETIFPFLEHELGLTKDMALLDIGSGTGLFSKHLLEKNYRLTCLEPNDEMRFFAEKDLAKFPNFTSKKATGEQTGIESNSIDCIFVAQAFHWLDPNAAKKEFFRVLKPNGKIVICWILTNQTSLFLKKYEELRQTFAINYRPVRRNNEEVIKNFYSPLAFSKRVFHFESFIDFDSLKGLLLSVSFMPQEGQPGYEQMIETLTMLFERFNKNGLVELKYDLPIYWND